MIDLKEMFDIVEIPVNLFYALILGEKKHKKSYNADLKI